MSFYWKYSFLFICFYSLFVAAQEPCLQRKHSDKFTGVSFQTEKKRLDKAVTELKSFKNKTLYLIALGNKSEATHRIEKSKQYLKKKHQIPPEKVVAIYGGNKAQIEMEIFVTTPHGDGSSCSESQQTSF